MDLCSARENATDFRSTDTREKIVKEPHIKVQVDTREELFADLKEVVGRMEHETVAFKTAQEAQDNRAKVKVSLLNIIIDICAPTVSFTNRLFFLYKYILRVRR